MKNAFDDIRVEEQLKRNTLAFLKGSIQSPPQKKRGLGFRRFSVGLACLLLLTFAGAFSYNSYFTETIYVDVDINPSMELTINRFDRIIGVYAYNKEGEDLLSKLNLMHQPYEKAVTMLTEAAIQNGFLIDGGLISVTFQSDKDDDEGMILKTLETNIVSIAREHHALVQVDVFSVNNITRESAHGKNMSPARYIAVMELQEVDPTATIEGCRNHTLMEIRTRIQECSDEYYEPENHGSGNGGSGHQGRGHHGSGHNSSGHDGLE